MDRYEEALEKARELHGTVVAGRDFLAEIFPELRESEDEKIRKAIMEVLKRVSGSTDVLENQGTTFKKAMIWLEKQKEYPTNEEMLRTLRAEYEKGVADTIAKYEQKEQKPAEWSEKDKDYYDAIIAKLEVTQDDAMLTDNQMDFLKSLPERLNLQPKREWSEEDEKNLGKLHRLLVICQGEMKFIPSDEYDKLDDWLKSLCPPQYCENCKLKRSVENWKPSEEQMKEYSYWYKNFIESGLASPSSKAVTVLGELLEQLKKL